MNNPYISIIIPVYNVEKMLRRCIDSVLRQKYQNYELLLIDDGSQDLSGVICDDYALRDSRIIVFHKENGGVSTARNLGIKKSLGQWLTFIDADDWVEPNYLSNIEDVNNADWIFAEWRTIWDKVHLNEILEYQDKLDYSSRKEIDIIWNKMANLDICRCPWGKFFKHSIIKENNILFDDDLHYGEDTVFNYQYLNYCQQIKLGNKPNAHYIFHQNEGTVAVNKYKCSAQGIISARKKVFDIYFERGYNNTKFERLFFFNYTMIEKLYLYKKDDYHRKEFYYSYIQQELEKRCLNYIKYYDKIMYLSFKNIPHFFINPIAKLYLKYR